MTRHRLVAFAVLLPCAAGFAQFVPLRRPCGAAARASTPKAGPFSGGGGRNSFGLDPRAVRRLAEMKRAGEPLQEEVQGLCVLGALVGALLAGPFLGGLIGAQLAPMLATIQGPTGDRIRAAGWSTWSAWGDVKRELVRGWRAVDARFDLRGRWARFDAPGRWRGFDAAYDLRGKAATAARWADRRLLRPLRAVLARVSAFLERRGITARAAAAWERTGLPRRWRAFEQEQILRARMRDMRDGGGAF